MNIVNNILSPNTAEKEKIAKWILKKRIPIHSTICITNSCNFRCRHCYVKPLRSSDNVLPLNAWIDILERLKRSGCISLTITGGEPICNSDFLRIYEAAYHLNLKITVMSNLSMFNDEIIDIFRKLPPVQIVGTLYGISNETYKSFCGIENGWDSVKRNIEKIKKNDLPLKLNTVLNTLNFHELEAMNEYAKMAKIEFHAYRKICSDVYGNNNPKKYQISSEQIEYSYQVLKDKEKADLVRNNIASIWENGYKNCCAGLSACYVNSRGALYLCNHCISPDYSLLEMSFDECWDKIYNLRKEVIEVPNNCGNCAMRSYCGKCTPIYVNEERASGFPFKECSINY